MGQAAVDLPESADNAAAPITNADDLLSQLAGEEIDRMLAESDSAPKDEQAPAAAGEQPVIEEEPIAPPAAMAEEVEAELKELADASAKKNAEDPFAAEVDELFRQLEADPAAPKAEPEKPQEAPVAAVTPTADVPTASTPAPAAAAAESVAKVAEPETPSAIAAPVATPPASTVVAEEQTSTAERAALAETPPPAPQPAPAKPVVTTHATPVVQTRVAAYVRVLELINGPFADCPQGMRDTLGKVAILTLMNSLGVLLYVMLFKH